MRPAFEESREPVLLAALRSMGFATLASNGAHGIVLAQAPFEVATENPTRVRFHLGRNHPLLEAIESSGTCSLSAVGPRGYISPAWYASKREHGAVVPTWNYLAVHVHGTAQRFEDRTALRSHVSALTDRHESSMPAPWKVDDAPEAYIAQMLAGIVGVELAVERMSGTWKLSQNKSLEDRNAVVAGLRERAGPGDAELADAVEATLA
tara:strand:- start:1400 stop:2023 length:624 start_codon:yes stop_codon:yes gene_type:complete